MGGAEQAAPTATSPSLRALTLASLRVGLLGFGGPAGQIALMHRVFVTEKAWIDEPRFLHALNYCMLLPGPEAQQLATYMGWLLRGPTGGLISGALFVLPGAAIVLGLSWMYAAFGQTPLAAALFYGIKAAVLAFILEALWRIGRRALRTRASVAIALLALAGLAILNAPFPIVILSAGLIGLFLAKPKSEPHPAPVPPRRARGAIQTAALCALAWLAPLAATLAALGPEHPLSRVGLLFAKLSLVTFGGAYATLAYLQQQAVEAEGWLSAAQMIDGLGLAETTPGPLVLVNQYVGFLAGWQAEGGGLGLALAAAAMASWMTFAPSFLFIFAGAPHAERLRGNRFAAGALSAISAAVLGVIGALAIDLAGQILAPQAQPDPIAAAIAAGAAFALIRLHANALLIVAACAALGALAHALQP